MTDRKPTFVEACDDLRRAIEQIAHIYIQSVRTLLPVLPILFRLIARVVFYVPEKWYWRLLYAFIVSGLAAIFVVVLATGAILRH